MPPADVMRPAVSVAVASLHVGHEQVRARAREGLGDGRADAGAGTGDKRTLSFELEYHVESVAT